MGVAGVFPCGVEQTPSIHAVTISLRSHFSDAVYEQGLAPMNTHRAYAMLNVATGILQEKAGNCTGNKARQMEGVRRQVLGRADARVQQPSPPEQSFQAYAHSTGTQRHPKGTE